MTDALAAAPALRPLREILAGTDCVFAGSVFDPISARIAQSLGHEIGVMGGSVASYAVLGAPDIILLTLTELVEQSRRVCRAARLNLIVDADHGYGNALNVMRTVEELGAAGVAGLGIEDTLLPRAYGSGETAQLVSIAEGVGKMKAAVAARGAGGPVILGRTNAVSITGVPDAIERLKAYQDTGVDALFVTGLKRREDLETIARAVRLPIMIGGAGPALGDAAFLAAHGVRVFLWGHQPMTAAVRALYDAMKVLRDGGTPADLTGLASPQLMATVTRSAEYEAMTRRYLGGGD